MRSILYRIGYFDDDYQGFESSLFFSFIESDEVEMWTKDISG